jgi:cytochrome P450
VTTAAYAIVPPAAKVHARDLPALRLIVQFARNTVSAMPNYAFDVMINHWRVLGLDTWLVNDPDGVRHILGSNVSNYRELGALYRVFRPLAGQGVFLAEGDEWRRQRPAERFRPCVFNSRAYRICDARRLADSGPF